jgi:hypothetical protein
MLEENENKKEKEKSKILEKDESDIFRYGIKKPTLSLSEEPNIINDETQYYDKITNYKSQKLKPNKQDLEFFYPNKFKNSFINEPISHNKDDSRSNLSEIQMIVKAAVNTNNENNHINKSNGKKEKKKINHTKRKNSVEQVIKNKKTKELDKEGDEFKINNDKIKKTHHSSKKKNK